MVACWRQNWVLTLHCKSKAFSVHPDVTSKIQKLEWKWINGWKYIIFSKYLHRLVVVHVDGVRLCLWTAVTNESTVHTPGDVNMENHFGMMLTGENRRTRIKTCPPQIPHELIRARSRASVVRGRQLTASVMARPSLYRLNKHCFHRHFTQKENIFQMLPLETQYCLSECDTR
jgi:hypothetical protein